MNNIRPLRHQCLTLAMLTVFLLLPTLNGAAATRTLTPEDGMNAVAAALKQARPGDVIHLAAGVYPGKIRVGGLKGSAEAPIVLEGESGTILGGDPEDNEGSSILLENSSHVLLRNLGIVGGQRGITLGKCSDVAVLECHVRDVSNYGIMSYRSSNITIERNVIERSRKEHGIYLSGQGSNVLILDNVIRQTHVNGIHINGELDNVRMIRNVLDRTGTYPTPEGGAGVTFFGGASNGLIANNLFLNIHGQCITNSGANLTIRNNIFDGYSWSVLLAVGAATRAIFTGNIVLPGKAVPLQVSQNFLHTLNSDHNHFDTAGAPVASGKELGMLSFTEWRKLGQDTHSRSGKAPIVGSTDGGDMLARYRLTTDGSGVDGGPEDQNDAAQPPGQGSHRADLGLFGGPDNAWPR